MTRGDITNAIAWIVVFWIGGCGCFGKWSKDGILASFVLGTVCFILGYLMYSDLPDITEYRNE